MKCRLSVCIYCTYAHFHTIVFEFSYNNGDLQVGLDVESESESTYRNVLTKLPSGQLILEDAYSAIQSVMKEFDNYVKVGNGQYWLAKTQCFSICINYSMWHLIINACRFGLDTSPCGIWTQMSYTVGWDSESNCGWIPLKKLSKYFAEVRRLDTCFLQSFVNFVLFVIVDLQGRHLIHQKPRKKLDLLLYSLARYPSSLFIVLHVHCA